nr:hypothetical protein [Tanacetum cinerariifolium]
MSRHTRASYVGTFLTMVVIVHHGSRLSMSRNRATIKTLCQPRNQCYFEPNPCYESNSSGFDQPPLYTIDHQPIIQEDRQWISDTLIKSNNEIFESVRSMFEEFPRRKQEKTILLRDIISQLPPSIVITTSPLVLPFKDPKDSLIMRNEELRTIPEKESDEVIKSSVEDFVPILSESEDTSESDSECDLPLCDDFSPINIPEGKSVTFSNHLFDLNDDFTFSDDESLSDEDVPKDY